MNKIHFSIIIAIVMILSSCSAENFEGISISSIPRNYREASIIKITHNVEHTEFTTMYNDKHVVITITPSLKKIFNKIYPNHIKINRIFNPDGVTTYVSFYENEIICIVIVDNDPMLTKPLDILTLTPGEALDSNSSDGNSKRIIISTLISDGNTIDQNLNPGEGYKFQLNSDFWEFYYLTASIPNLKFMEKSSQKKIPLEEPAFLVDWVAMLKKDHK
jgi:hypothetical protein